MDESESLIHEEESVSQDGNSSVLTSPQSSIISSEKSTEKGTPSNRRLSRRVKAKPAYFDASPILSPYNKQKSVTPSPQLKSPSLNESVDAEENNDNTLVEETQDVSEDDEITFKKPLPNSKRKTKPVLNVTVKKGRSSAKKKVNNNTTDDDDEDASLFEIVKGGRSALVSVVNEWIDEYNVNKTSAMRRLIEFFVNCAGCNAMVTKEMIESEDEGSAIRHLTENFGESAEEYPLTIIRPEYKKFKSNFSMFISQLISLCQINIIYDEDMTNKLLTWIIGLSDSQVRAFRHTSTFAAMKIVTALIDIAVKVEVEIDNIQRQIDGESKANKKTREKIEKLNKRKNELQQNKTELEELMESIFTAVFMNRYRDIRPEIRCVCLAELGLWMDRYSFYFLKEKYLKYLGWMLHDKVGAVRLQCLKSLESLYKNEEYAEHLELFTSRFKNRLIHMTLDVETDVAVLAIKIASLLHKYDVLEEDDCSQVEQLVFCDNRQMAHAAGEFLTQRILKLSIEASPKKLSKAHKDDYLRQMNIKAILDFFIKTEIHDHCSYIVDSLWEHTNLLKDWKTMTNLLLDSKALLELDDREEDALIDLICCSCKQAATGVRPPGRSLHKKMSIKDKRTVLDDKQSISYHFMEHLPQLIDKYKADSSKLSQLLHLPEYFDLESYTQNRYAKFLEDLLDSIEEITCKHADEKVLEACSNAYLCLLDHDFPFKQSIVVSRNRLLDGLVDTFKESIRLGIPTSDDSKEGKSYHQIITSLKRLKAFSSNHDLSDWDTYKDVDSIINQAVSNNVEEEILIQAIQVMYFSFLMQLDKIYSKTDFNKEELKVFRKRQKTFMRQMDELLQYSSNAVKTMVYKVLCDYFVYFARQLANKNDKFAQIVSESSTLMQVRMRDFVISNVFNTIEQKSNQETTDNLEDEEEEKNEEELHEKRVLLAGFSKLVAFRIFDIKLAAPIFSQLLRAYVDYGDIIKALMKESKDGNIFDFSKTLLLALQQAFETLRDESDGVINPKSKEFSAIKDLAHRFALTIGVDTRTDNTRKIAITINKHGITYAFSYQLDPDDSPSKSIVPEVPPNILFLEVLQEFANKVHPIDRKIILAHLEETGGTLLDNTGVGWEAIQQFKKSMEGGTEQSKITDDLELDENDDGEETAKPRSKKTLSTRKTTKPETPASKKKVSKKKLSMSAVGGTDKWLSKKTIEDHQKEPPTKVARPIPKLNKSKKAETPKTSRKRVATPASQQGKSNAKSPKKANSKSSSANSSPAKSPKKNITAIKRAKINSPKKSKPSPSKGRSPVKKSPLKKSPVKASKTTPRTKAEAGKRGSVAMTPLRLSGNTEEDENQPHSDEIHAEKDDVIDEDSTIHDTASDADDSQSQSDSQETVDSQETNDSQDTFASSQKSVDYSQTSSWVKKPKSLKHARKSYSMRSNSPLKRTRSVMDESSQDSGSDVSRSDSPRSRALRASKRQKRDTSATPSDNTMDDSSSMS